MNIFKDQCLYVNSCDFAFCVNGKIKEAYFNQNGSGVHFTLDNKDTSYKVDLMFQGGFISSAEVLTESRDLLRYAIKDKHRQNFPVGNKLLSSIVITVNENFVTEKTAVLPNGTYDVIVGSRFKGEGIGFEKGHFLHLKNKKTNQTIDFEIYTNKSKVRISIFLKIGCFYIFYCKFYSPAESFTFFS